MFAKSTVTKEIFEPSTFSCMGGASQGKSKSAEDHGVEASWQPRLSCPDQLLKKTSQHFLAQSRQCHEQVGLCMSRLCLFGTIATALHASEILVLLCSASFCILHPSFQSCLYRMRTKHWLMVKLRLDLTKLKQFTSNIPPHLQPTA